ncbi:50S ribosomal protein L7ae-like protein [Lentibacillus cibarius]|uniref:50S ribosomal protein L7ae-like protein n=1 Tax=Lentibacillus cibarius TaxID=2583219 RepID=A0A549YH07_9BACI|nr:ribosomal L7Ae/L30e/S12e/Gadd45 family protein [Lentibacillus cibarius]TRM11163.1 50S ribosomal protein L7ae-like protein [Lentibacillus cibarius]
MSYEKVTRFQKNLVIGTKQTLKAIRNGAASEVFIADDADWEVTQKVEKLAEELGVPYRRVDSKKRLGSACGIDVDASAVAVKQ